MKNRTHFTRKNLIFLALLFFLLVIQIFVAVCLDVNFGMKEDNPIAAFAKIFGINQYALTTTDYVCFFLSLFYTLLGSAALIYEYRIARFYKEPIFSLKRIGGYLSTILLCALLSLGLSLLLQTPFDFANLGKQLLFLWQTFIVAFIIYIVFAALIVGVCAIIVNFKHIDEPFRFFGKEDAAVQEEIENREAEEALEDIENSDLTNSLDVPKDEFGNPLPGYGGPGVGGPATIGENETKEKEKIFPGLCSIDNEFSYGAPEIASFEMPLDEFCTRFRNYLACNGLYFSEKIIRQYISAFSTTRLVILEGLSGTGKSSLPRYLARFISNEAFFAPVQSTWRDRSNIVGYYNDFTGTFNETDFLKNLYRATYEKDRLNLMVLDEMNLSRIEYYFADFLSILEYPADLWYLHVMQLPYGFEAPHHLMEGKIKIPENTFFVGTANKDDSTYTITDKVYDRAITIDFEELNEPFEVDEIQEPIEFSYDTLAKLYSEARLVEENRLTKEELAKFRIISDFTYETFDLAFGNRILNQIHQFVPVYVACGGTKVEALDFLFTRKILYKIEGRFEDYIKNGLLDLKDLVIKEFGNEFEMTIKEINRLLKRL